MPTWVCPQCARHFSRVGQSHECAPAMTLEEYFSTGPEHERPIYEAVMRHMVSVGPVHVEPVSVGIFLKRARSFAQLRPRQQWVALSFSLPHPVQHPRILNKVQPYGGSYFHVANLRSPEDVDTMICGYLTEAYLNAPDRRRAALVADGSSS